MSHAATTFVPSFHPQRPALAVPQATVTLPSRLIELARKADSAGCPQAAGLLVGAALRQVRRAVAKLHEPLADIDLGGGLPQG